MYLLRFGRLPFVIIMSALHTNRKLIEWIPLWITYAFSRRETNTDRWQNAFRVYLKLTLQNVCPKLNLAHYVINTGRWAVGFFDLCELFWVLRAICILRWCETFNRLALLFFFLPTYWLATGWLRQYLNWCVPLVSLLLHNSYTIKCDQCTQHTRNETEKTTKFGTSLVNRCQYLLMKDDLEIVSLFFLLVIQVERIILCTKIP